MSTFVPVKSEEELLSAVRAGLLWLRGDDPTDEYSPCSYKGVTEEYQKGMTDGGWKYAILIGDDGGDD